MVSLNLTYSDVQGRSSPSPGLLLHLHIKPEGYHPKRTLALAHIYPQVRLEAQGVTQRFDSRVLALYGEDVGADQHFDVRLLVEMPLAALEGFEEKRRGNGSVTITIDLGATVFEVNEELIVHHPQHPDISPPTARPLGRFERVHTDSNPLRIEQDRDAWARLLAELQYADVLVLELDTRRASANGPFKHAATHLQTAQRAFHDGRYADVTVAAYKALECLVPTGDPGVPQRLSAKYFVNAHNEIQRRVSRAMQAFMPLVHVGRHATGDDAAPDVEVDRHHAQLVLATSAALVSWCRKLGG